MSSQGLMGMVGRCLVPKMIQTEHDDSALNSGRFRPSSGYLAHLLLVGTSELFTSAQKKLRNQSWRRHWLDRRSTSCLSVSPSCVFHEKQTESAKLEQGDVACAKPLKFRWVTRWLDTGNNSSAAKMLGADHTQDNVYNSYEVSDRGPPVVRGVAEIPFLASIAKIRTASVTVNLRQDV